MKHNFIEAGTQQPYPAFTVDQTQLVDVLLKGDKKWQYSYCLSNQYHFKAELSDGGFEGSNYQLDAKITQLENQIRQLERMIEQAHEFLSLDNIKQEIECLESDLDVLSKTPGSKKEVHYWLLVPYWLSEMFLKDGEVILRAFGNNWWGLVLRKVAS